MSADLKHTSPGLKKTLVLWQVIIVGLATMQPMTVFDTFGIVGNKSENHVPSAYIVALIAMLFTALSYGHMARRFPSSGSAYTYTQRTISPSLGFLVGWTSLLDYLFMPMVNILLATIYLHTLFPDVPTWTFVVGLSILMTVVNLKGIEIVAHFNTVIVVFQLLFIAVFVGMVVFGLTQGEGAGTLVSSEPFVSTELAFSGVVAGATILCFSFLGFDGLSSLSEETKDAAKVIPRAIFLTTLIGGVIFIITTYFLQLYFPHTESVFQKPDESQPEIFLYVAGKAFQSVGLCFSIVTVFASGMAAHTGASRLMYVMGRDGIFPKKWFGHVHPTWQTPSINVILVGIVGFSAIFLDLEEALHLVNFGALTAFTFVNLSVIVQYYWRDGLRSGLKNNIKYLFLPGCGTLSIGLLWYFIEVESLYRGLVWMAFGLIYLAIVTKGFKKYPQAFLDKAPISED